MPNKRSTHTHTHTQEVIVEQRPATGAARRNIYDESPAKSVFALLLRFGTFPLLIAGALIANYINGHPPLGPVGDALLSTAVLPGASHRPALPTLPFPNDALEPVLSNRSLDLHRAHHLHHLHSLHPALAANHAASLRGDLRGQLAGLPDAEFHAGAHVNHALFWQNLAPAGSADAAPAAAPRLYAAIRARWGGAARFREEFEAAAMGVLGPGWVWVVKMVDGVEREGRLEIVTTKGEEAVVGAGEVPVLGIDLWEHAYYPQYGWNKTEYVRSMWNVINWSMCEKRYLAPTEEAWTALQRGL